MRGALQLTRVSIFAAILRSFPSSLALFLLLFSSLCEARDILVGGKTDSWKIPTAQSDTINQWAGDSRFRIGDTLVLNYDKEKDSVLEVTKEAYMSCNTSNPITEYKDGNTKVKLDRSGPFYFISGAEGHCAKGLKLIVVVMSPRHSTISSPAPSPMESEGPAVAPTSSATSLKATILMGFGAVFGFGFLIM
ncbi:early nodulin-like protein 14 [Rutidosis leptorrhynchoides]|uniref:early nodulin-like protein 14 n=1 Tax=Rutidosis leptorrhynchoides TaxID=125765 RepID=UPI003A9964AB